jgi:hypothetical protein
VAIAVDIECLEHRLGWPSSGNMNGAVAVDVHEAALGGWCCAEGARCRWRPSRRGGMEPI